MELPRIITPTAFVELWTTAGRPTVDTQQSARYTYRLPPKGIASLDLTGLLRAIRIYIGYAYTPNTVIVLGCFNVRLSQLYLQTQAMR